MISAITSFNGEHRFLSNFYLCRVEYEGVWYDSVEHAYQAAKWPSDQREQFRKGITPAQAKNLGKQATLPSNWYKKRIGIMQALVRQKFLNHPQLGELLMATGTVRLIEWNYWGDIYWGVCNGVGLNHLGLILMEVRQELLNQRTLQYFFIEEHPGE